MEVPEHLQARVGEILTVELYAAQEKLRPCVLFQPRIFKEGTQWCVLLGDNIQEGVAGFGETAREAYADFDRSWNQDGT